MPPGMFERCSVIAKLSALKIKTPPDTSVSRAACVGETCCRRLLFRRRSTSHPTRGGTRGRGGHYGAALRGGGYSGRLETVPPGRVRYNRSVRGVSNGSRQ